MSIEIAENVRDELLRDLHEVCLLWRFRRVDRTKFYWTNHNAPVQWPQPGGPTYLPAFSPNMGDEKKSAGTNSDSAEMRGAILTDAITLNDVRAGRWKNCKVTEYLVNWRHGWFDPILTTQYFIQDMEADGEGWRCQLQSVSHLLNNLVGITAGAGCRNVFGAAFGKGANYVGCRFDLTANAADTITGVPITTVVDQRIVELDTSFISSQADGYYDNGTLEWSVGANLGMPAIKVDTYIDTNRRFELVKDAPYPITTGDRVTVRRGCAKTWADCEDRSQTANYRGFRFMPTEEDLEPAKRSRE